MSRRDRLLKNFFFGMTAVLVNVIAGFIAQRIFVRELGYTTLGLNAVFVSVINTLSIAEIGIGTAIVFSLYKPLAENDERKVALLIKYYRKAYLIIGGVVVAAGLAVMPALPLLTGYEFDFSYLLPIYALFLGNAFIGYLFTYNHTLLSADQKQYAVSFVSTATKVVASGGQIALLILTKNYILFLAYGIVVTSAFNVALTVYVRKKYPYLGKFEGVLSKEETKPIRENVAALIFHRIGNYLVTGTGGLIISSFIGVVYAGYYSNYFLLVGYLAMLLNGALSGVTAAFGHSVATEDKPTVYAHFKRVRFLNFMLYAVAAVGTFVTINDILRVWLGGETVLPGAFLLLFAVNFFITGYSSALGSLRAAAGVFKPDKYLHILIAVLNVGLSLGFVRVWGIAGVLLGTTVSLIIKELAVLPIIGKKYIYGGRVRDYYLRFLFDFGCAAACAAAAYFIYGLLPIGSVILKLCAGAAACVVLTAAVLSCLNFRADEFKYILNLFKWAVGKIKTSLVGVFKKAEGGDGGTENP